MNLKQHANKPQRLFNKLILKYSDINSFVLVEGITDRAIWTKFKAKRCMLEPAEGRNNVLETLKIVERERPLWRNVVAIVDPDLWLVDPPIGLELRRVLFDDVPDLELTLFNSLALDTFFHQVLTAIEPRRLSDFVREVKRIALGLATEYGYFRLIHHQNPEYGLRNLRKVAVSIKSYITDEILNLDLIAEKLLEGSAKHITKLQLLEEVGSLRAKYPPPEIKLCRGKDVFSIMAVVLPALFRKQFKNDTNSLEKLIQECGIQAKQNRFSAELRKCYEYRFFKKTALFERIRKWESQNSPFRIVKE